VGRRRRGGLRRRVVGLLVGDDLDALLLEVVDDGLDLGLGEPLVEADLVELGAQDQALLLRTLEQAVDRDRDCSWSQFVSLTSSLRFQHAPLGWAAGLGGASRPLCAVLLLP
jgi:hypothetical protein